MKKLIGVLTAMFFLGSTAVTLAAPVTGSPVSTHGLKTGLTKPRPKTHKKPKKAHPVNRGAEESAEKGANGPENASTSSAGHAGAATMKGAVSPDGKGTGVTFRK